METDHLFTTEIQSKIESVKKLLEEDSSFDEAVGKYLIITFLYANECDVEKAKEQIITYCKCRKQYPRILKPIDFLDENIQRMYRRCILITDINQKQLEFPLVIVINTSQLLNFNVYEAINVALYSMITGVLDSKRVRDRGVILIFNLTDLPYSILLSMTPSLIFQAVPCEVCVIGHLLKKVYIINAGIIVGATIRAIRLLMPNHINKIVFLLLFFLEIHSGSWECLKDEIPSESLPIEFGGTNGTIEEYHLLPIMIKWREVIFNHF
ncbi:hypothetical protein CHUAL_002839 [Chamberlinius hualienensis]